MEFNNREIGASLILVFMIAFWTLSSIRKRIAAERKKKILKQGVQANATVLAIKPTGEYLNNLPEFQVQIKVESKAGNDFVTEMREVLPYAKYDSLRQGTQVLVKYDPAYYKRAIFLQMAETLV
ncbi:hypothetical protein LZD49_01610 [Dyadobacter sp. CY261]|uniref:hypothetical protein n=1 Tax=Dyadobacter sp. CY261 TaxID=2907203 RepID=UPI001F450499|nr:hypothetical protein [Dyadobacter sp. CY261]MCF0069148.1 hypothetical protein [Dyadobacter sp. CY261]